MRYMNRAVVCLLLCAVCAAVEEHQIVRYGGPAKRLRGTVTDWSGAPIPDTQVEIYDNPQVWDSSLSFVEVRSKQKKIASAITDDKGRYDIRGVPAGHYEVQFSRMGWNILSVLMEVGGPRAASLCVELQISGGAGRGQVKKCKQAWAGQ